MMSAWGTIEAHIEHNWEIYMATASAVAIAAVCCWPERIPASAQDWWTRARATFQTAVPAARHAQQQQLPELADIAPAPRNPTKPSNPPEDSTANPQS